MNTESVKLKLFVWEDFATDYTHGLAVALAPDVETARRLLREKLWEVLWNELDREPQTIEDPAAFYVCGGG